MLKDKHWYLKNIFKYEKFRDGQEYLMDLILNKKNILAILPTGAGKSLIYQIPAIMSEKYSIVISPLISLMQDQVYNLNSLKELSAYINSTLSNQELSDIYNKVLDNKIKLLYVSPERLENNKFQNFISNFPPDYIFIDEAHCISQWGNSFRPSYKKIKDIISLVNPKAIAAFTASATQDIINDIVNSLGVNDLKVIKTGFYRDNISINIFKNLNKKQKLVELLNSNQLPGIIYVATRKLAEEISFYLNHLGFKNECYHAGLIPNVRKTIQENFSKGKLDLIVATNAFGMGVDKSDIRTIIHYNTPNNFEAYYQEIGRAGRDGKTSKAFLLYNKDDDFLNNFFIENNYPDDEIIYKFYDFLYDNGNIALGSKSSEMLMFSNSAIERYFHKSLSDSIIDILLNWFEQYNIIERLNYKNQLMIKIIFSKDEIKKYLINEIDETKKIIMSNLINVYKNKVFENFVPISLSEFAHWIDIKYSLIENYLLELEKKSIIQLQKINSDFCYITLKEREKNPDLKLLSNEVAKLKTNSINNYEQFKEFIYSSKCRMNALVNYFGEKTSKNCGICDNCLNISDSLNLSFVDFIIKRTLEIEPELSKQDILEIIKGRSENIFFPTFGLAQGYPEDILIEVLKKYNQSNKIKKAKLIYKKEDIELYNELLKIREKKAIKFNQTPEKICSEKILVDIVLAKPKNIFELLSIDGFDKNKYNKIGDDVLEIINTKYKN